MMFNFLAAKDMGIDLGTANTLIYIKDSGIVLEEPSVIALDSKRGITLAVGDEAKKMVGKAPSNISVVRPLREGVISDFDRTADMLREFIMKAVSANNVKNFRVVVGVPSGVTEVEKRAVEEVVRQMGATEVYILEEPMAAAIGAGIDVDSSSASMIADIGGGTTDIAIIALGGIVASASVKMAGDRTAEMLKIKVGTASIDIDENGDEIIETVKASGRDLLTGLPKTLEVSNRDMMIALQESVDIIVDGVKATIEKAPPEIAADIAEKGMILSGGGGLIKNLDKLIESRTGMNVGIAENAFEAVATGTGMSLNDVEKLKVYATTVNRR